MIATKQINLFGAVIEGHPAPVADGNAQQFPSAKKPVRIRFMRSNYGNEHLYFWCQGYRPYGGNPEYPEDRKYRCDSEMCDGCFKIVDGVPFQAQFSCSRDDHGSENHVYQSLFNQNPLDHVDKYERKQIAAGLKLLWRIR